MPAMRSVDEHRRVVADLITARPAAQVPIADALGLVLGADVVAPLSRPGFDNSAMDGYAILTEDIASAIVFLASDASSWMTGEVMVIDGGQRLGDASQYR